MRLAIAALLIATSTASAGPFELGASLGIAQDKAYDSSTHALGVFARAGLFPGLAAQVEVAKLENDTMGTQIRSGSGLLVIDLGVSHVLPVAPILFGGAGFDTTSDINADRTFAHGELGAGLEYRSGALVIGADVRIGARKLVTDRETGVLTYLEPLTLSEGEYRSARLTLGVAF
jgi:hypothetical protein